jgi:transcriptional regulator of acetoin/glycerol metabolism
VQVQLPKKYPIPGGGVVDYRIDPRSRTVPNIITQGKLKVSREPLADVIVHAREEIDRLCAIVRQQAYVVLLCNDDGLPFTIAATKQGRKSSNAHQRADRQRVPANPKLRR